MAVVGREALSVIDIGMGVHARGYSRYPECRQEFRESFLRAVHRGPREGSNQSDQPWWRLQSPLVEMSKAQIIRTATELGVDLSLTLSCYAPDAAGQACGRCDSCGLRRRGFEEAAIPDPTRYQNHG